MASFGSKLRKIEGGYAHWCAGCSAVHLIFTNEALPNGSRWDFNGDAAAPTFTPSILIRGAKIEVCHYFVTDGLAIFLNDCTHAMRGKTIPLPDLPPHLRD